MSNYFEWDAAKFGLGVHAMDEEHQQLIRYMNTLHDLHCAHAPRDEVGRALDVLARYTVKHFADEELYMAKIGFPELAKHKLVHRDLLAKVGLHVADFKKTGTLSEPFFVFLKMWLKAHICGIDIKYARQAAVA
jgi:hemerythrin